MITNLSSEHMHYITGGGVCLKTVLFSVSYTCVATGLALQTFGYALHVNSPYRPEVVGVGDSPTIPAVSDNRFVLRQRTWGVSFATIGFLLSAGGAILMYMAPTEPECN